MNNLTSELEYALSENLSDIDMIDLWIQQDSAFAVIKDIQLAIEHAQTEKGEYASKTVVTNDVLDKIMRDLEKQESKAGPILESFKGIGKGPVVQQILEDTYERIQDETEITDFLQMIFNNTVELFSEMVNEFNKAPLSLA